MEARYENGTKVDLHVARVAGRLERVEGRIATVPANTQLPNSRIQSQKAEQIKASCLSNYNDDESIKSGEPHEASETEYESDSSRSVEEDTRRRHRKKTMKEGFLKQVKDANWPFEKRDPKHCDLKNKLFDSYCR